MVTDAMYMVEKDGIFKQLTVYMDDTLSPSMLKLKQKSRRCFCEKWPDILITDDNVFNVITLETMIQATFNMECERALNGQEAFTKVTERMKEGQKCTCNNKKCSFKIIFMDCNMPIMDGFQATNEIRNVMAMMQPSTYIVALTAYSTEAFKQKCFDAGMDNFITKPISMKDLRYVLKEADIIN